MVKVPPTGEAVHRVAITGAGNINGVTFEAAGTGTGDPSTGRWQFSVDFSRLPPKADPFATLLGILILPTVIFGRELGRSTNLLSLARGAVEFTQLVRGDDIAVSAAGAVRISGDRQLHWHSEAHGELAIPHVESVEEFDAVMLPQGDGRFADVFALPLVTAAGRSIVHVLRTITFNPRAALPQVQYRRISMSWTVEGPRLSVTTLSTIRGSDASFRLVD